MNTIKKIYDEHFGALLCVMICASVMSICAAFITGSEFLLNTGLLLVSFAVILPFIVEPKI